MSSATPGTTEEETAVALTQLATCAGCAAKLPQAILATLLKHLPHDNGRKLDPRVLVGSDGFDDAGIYRLRKDLALVQTVDFFTPIVDDPYSFGQIAAANAISDVYAMGGTPITAMNLLGAPADKLSPKIIARILKGGADKASEVGCNILGGHTIRLSEPMYGLSVTGIVHPGKILKNSAARAGDLLVLTKPIGTGITTTGIKRGLASKPLMQHVIRSMKQVNTAGADLGKRRLVRAATDVTGFGLIGHLGNIVRASEVTAEIVASDVPTFGKEVFGLVSRDCVPGGTRSNLEFAASFTDWSGTSEVMRIVFCDAQTSGGLLLCVPPRHLNSVRAVLSAHRASSTAVIGRILRGPAQVRVI